MKKLSSLLLIAMSLFWACNPINEEDLQPLLNTVKELNAIEARVMAIEPAELNSIANTVEHNLEYMRENFKDYNNRDFVIETLSDYRAIRKPLKNYGAKHQLFLKEIEYSKSQLKNLKNDAEAGKLDKTTYIGYLETEMQAVNTLKSKVNEAVGQVEALVTRFNQLNPVVKEAMDQTQK